MRTIKTAAVVVLLLLIPHQEPFAEVVERVTEATASIQASPVAKAGPTTNTSDAVATSEGYVRSVAQDRETGEIWSASSGHREVDGYSWSSWRAAQTSAFDRNP